MWRRPEGGRFRRFLTSLGIVIDRNLGWILLAGIVVIATWLLWALQFPAGLATFFAAIGVLVTYLLNRSQTEDHFRRRQMEERFSEILDCLANVDAGTRAGATDRLLALAQYPSGRWPSYVVYLDYPYYRRGVEQLCRALLCEKDKNVRAAIVSVLHYLTHAASTDWNTLTEVLLHEYADLNRSAFWAFLESIAAVLHRNAGRISIGDLKRIVPLARFTDTVEMDLRILALCINVPEFSSSLEKHWTIGEELHWATAAKEISTCAGRLIDTSWILAGVLRKLARYAADHRSQDLHLAEAHPMVGCFMCGVDLSECFMKGAHLQGSFLLRSYLQRSNLFGAKLHRACLHGASIEGASFRDSDLTGTWLGGLDFDTQDVPWQHQAKGFIESATLPITQPDFRDTNWHDARFEDPILIMLGRSLVDAATMEHVKASAERE